MMSFFWMKRGAPRPSGWGNAASTKIRVRMHWSLVQTVRTIVESFDAEILMATWKPVHDIRASIGMKVGELDPPGVFPQAKGLQGFHMGWIDFILQHRLVGGGGGGDQIKKLIL